MLRFLSFLVGGLAASSSFACDRGGEGGGDIPSALEAVGAIMRWSDRDAALRVACTGFLVAPTKVVSAKHCVLQMDPGPLAFVLGEDPAAGGRSVDIVDADLLWMPPFGAIRGSDVAVMTLREPIVEVVPLTVGDLGLDDVGRQLRAVGYGRDIDELGDRPSLRTAKDVTITLLEGNAFDQLFGSYEGYLAEAETIFPGMNAEALLTQYERGVLVEGYEAFAASPTAEGATCFGDSGGPLLRDTDGVPIAVGIVSAGVVAGCELGDIFAILGPEADAMLEVALARTTDVCGGESEAGRCDGDVVVRCDAGSGPRHVLELDCASRGEVCGPGDGHVDCVPP